MDQSEQQLITGLFERMRSFGTPEKDAEAEALIKQAIQQIPDAPYMLVQSVLVQEHALQQADQRIRELEERMRELESRAPAPAPAQAGGFLGGLFGGGARPAAPAQRMGGSVPSAGSRPGSAMGSGPMGAPSGPFGQQQPNQQQPQRGGGFLQSAMATAAGVAGGMLLANSISSMLGGGSATQAQGADASSPQPEAQQTADAGADSNDANLQNADHDTGSDDWGGGDWGGDDFDI